MYYLQAKLMVSIQELMLVNTSIQNSHTELKDRCVNLRKVKRKSQWRFTARKPQLQSSIVSGG